jgi:hypothetical protein
MYFQKELYHNIPVEQQRSFSEKTFESNKVKLDSYKKYFYWLDNVHNKKELDGFIKQLQKKTNAKKNKDKDGKIINDYTRFFPDLAASIIQTCYAAGHFESSQWEISLSCIADIILDLGYLELTERNLENEIKVSYNEVANVMLVAGCQDRVMLERRIRQSSKIYAMCDNNIKVVYSGRNPNYEQENTIKNESVRMENLFVSEIRKKIPEFTMSNYNTENEGASKITKENVSQFFEGGYLIDKKPNNILIVSSSSHLIRLSQDIEKYIKDNNPKYQIKQIILIGSEDKSDKYFITYNNIIKHIFLEINDYLQKKYYKQIL